MFGYKFGLTVYFLGSIFNHQLAWRKYTLGMGKLVE